MQLKVKMPNEDVKTIDIDVKSDRVGDNFELMGKVYKFCVRLMCGATATSAGPTGRGR